MTSAVPIQAPSRPITSGQVYGELALLGAIWGASFMFMRVAAPAFGWAALVEMRLVLGALILLPFLWRARARIGLRMWPMLALIGAINSAVPFLLFAWAAQRAPAGIGAICNAMTVLFTALVGALFFHEAIGGKRALTLVTGFIGVVVLAGGSTAAGSVWPAVLAGTAAAFLYGVGVHLVRRHLSHLPPAVASAGTLTAAAVINLPLALLHWPDVAIPGQAWLAAGALGVLCTGVAYALYYRLIQRIGGARASTVTYLVPLFGVSWAWLLLDEAVTWRMAIACMLILGSVFASQRLQQQ